MKKHAKKILAAFSLFALLASDVAFAAAAPYRVVSRTLGYVTKSDPTNLAEPYLVAGSQNVIINDQEKVESRGGYELFGAASTTANAIKSDFVWKNSTGGELFLRETNGVLQFMPNATSTDNRNWENLYGNLNPNATSTVRFAPVWNQAEGEDLLLFVNASTTLFEWSGGQATFSSAAATTITINEDIASSTAASRFYTTGTRGLRIKDASGTWQTFRYTGQSGKQFTSVTPDPTAYTFPTNALVVQEVRVNENTPSSNFISDTIAVLNNQVWLGSSRSRVVLVSKNTSHTDFNFSSPRVVGDGASLTFDDVTVGFASPDENVMLVFSGKDRVYKAAFEPQTTDTGIAETIKIKPLLVSAGQGAQSQELVGKIKQAVVWVSNNNELVELGQVENLPSPQSVAISDPIKPDFKAANFTNGEIDFWRNSIFITAPADGRVFIFDLARRFWQSPQVMPMRRLSQYQNDLYGHSGSAAESYKLFTGVNDNGLPISFKAHYAYQNGGRREVLKSFDRFFTELYLASNTQVTVSLLYEWKGAKLIQSYELDGASTDFLFTPSANASLGVNPLGTNPLGGLLAEGENTPKYRRFKPIVPTDYFEYQVRFETEVDDAAFQILAFGANEVVTGNILQKINQ